MQVEPKSRTTPHLAEQGSRLGPLSVQLNGWRWTVVWSTTLWSSMSTFLFNPNKRVGGVARGIRWGPRNQQEVREATKERCCHGQRSLSHDSNEVPKRGRGLIVTLPVAPS